VLRGLTPTFRSPKTLLQPCPPSPPCPPARPWLVSFRRIPGREETACRKSVCGPPARARESEERTAPVNPLLRRQKKKKKNALGPRHAPRFPSHWAFFLPPVGSSRHVAHSHGFRIGAVAFILFPSRPLFLDRSSHGAPRAWLASVFLTLLSFPTLPSQACPSGLGLPRCVRDV